MNGFGHDLYTVLYRINGKPTNPFSAEEMLVEHLRSVPKDGGRRKTHEKREDTSLYANGNRVYDYDGTRLSPSGGPEVV